MNFSRLPIGTVDGKQHLSEVVFTVLVGFCIVHHEYGPQGQTISKEYYRDVLRRLLNAVWRKRPEL